MQMIELSSRQTIPVLGRGTWKMSESSRSLQREVETLRCGLELGLTLIDTAKMYGEGGAGEVVAQAISDCVQRSS